MVLHKPTESLQELYKIRTLITPCYTGGCYGTERISPFPEATQLGQSGSQSQPASEPVSTALGPGDSHFRESLGLSRVRPALATVVSGCSLLIRRRRREGLGWLYSVCARSRPILAAVFSGEVGGILFKFSLSPASPCIHLKLLLLVGCSSQNRKETALGRRTRHF